MKPAASRRPAPRPRARRLLPEARQVQLLECAVRVFARRGIAAARHAEVAEAANVAVSTVFVYFPTRDDLVAAVLDSVERLYVELAERVHAARRPAPELLLGHAAAFAEAVDAHPDHARIWLDWSSAVGVDGIWPRYRRMENRVVRVIAKTLARGQREGSFSSDVAAEDGARISIGAGYMIAQMKLSRRPRADVARFVDALVRVLTGGLAAGAS